MSTDLTEALERDLEKARYQIEKQGVKGGGSTEGKYAVIYQRMVRIGARPQIRRKYREA